MKLEDYIITTFLQKRDGKSSVKKQDGKNPSTKGQKSKHSKLRKSVGC